MVSISLVFEKRVSRGSVVGIATAYGLDNRGVGVRVLVESEFSLLYIVLLFNGYRGFVLRG
jgi:hypothetical protein